jgi:uncharacterized protein YutD
MCDDIELTEAEKAEALAQALLKKRQTAAEAAYWARVWKSKTPDTPQEYYLGILKQYGYIVEDWNREVVNELCYFFSNDTRFNGDLGKGLLLYGPYGCGKSSIMRLLQVNSRLTYGITTVEKVQEEYERTGSISRYKRQCDTIAGNLFNHKLGGWFIDDIAKPRESAVAHYANKIEVVPEILEAWYVSDMPRYGQHMATNANKAELAAAYPFLVKSGRLAEMFNVISWPADSPNMRINR